MISEKDYKVNSPLDNYFMKPYYLNRLGLVYPISLYEYDDFSPLASEFILLDMPKRNNLAKQQFEKAKIEGIIDYSIKFEPLEQTHLFDWITSSIEHNKEQEEVYKEIKEKTNGLPQEQIEEVIKENENCRELIVRALNYSGKSIKDYICELISKTVKCEVVYEYVTKCFCVIKDNKITGVLDRDNFYEYRKVVMEQNVLHEPRVGGNVQSQEYIDRELKVLYGDNESSVESMVAFVSSSNSRDISDYTYYRLKADFIMEMRKLDYSVTNNYNANGCKTKDGGSISVPSITEPLGLDVNPYTKNAKSISEKDMNRTTLTR
jgi:hypothetical protein